MTRHIMVLLHPQRDESAVAAVSVFKALLDDGVTPVVLSDEIVGIRARQAEAVDDEPILHHCIIIDPSELGEWKNACELVIVLGGDGTILRAAERFHGSGAPLMGVNLGHVGFLAESEKEDLAEAVHRASQRDYSVEERLALDVSVWHEGENIFNAWALNEATIEKTSKSRMIDVVLGVDARPVSSFGCDGVILATPPARPRTRSPPRSHRLARGRSTHPRPDLRHALFSKPRRQPDVPPRRGDLPDEPEFSAVLVRRPPRPRDCRPGRDVEATRSKSPIRLARSPPARSPTDSSRSSACPSPAGEDRSRRPE